MEKTENINQKSPNDEVQGEEQKSEETSASTSESFLSKTEDEVKDIISDVKENLEKVEENIVETFEKVKDFVEGEKSVEDMDLIALEQENNSEHDSKAVNGGRQIADLSGEPADSNLKLEQATLASGEPPAQR